MKWVFTFFSLSSKMQPTSGGINPNITGILHDSPKYSWGREAGESAPSTLSNLQNVLLCLNLTNKTANNGMDLTFLTATCHIRFEIKKANFKPTNHSH